MSDLDERRVGDLRVIIDRHLCVGFGDCIDEAPGAFELDDDGIAVVRDGVEATPRERLLEAARVCPVDAIVIYDGEDDQLAP